MTTASGAAVLSGDVGAAGAGGDGSAVPASAAAAAEDTGTPPAAGQAANSEWYSALEDETMRGWVQNKGWKDPLEAVKSGYNLEKLIGFEKAGRTIVLPKEDATPEEMRAFYSKLGVPEKAEDYKLPVPEGESGEFAATASKWMHELGIPPKQAEALAAKWNEHVATLNKGMQTQTVQQQEAQLASVKAEWGAAAEQNIELAKRAASQFLPAEDGAERQQLLTNIERAIGTEKMLKLFAGMGKGLGEHKMVEGDGNSGNQAAMTPAQAKQRIEALKGDREWSTKYLNGDPTAKAEMARLSAYAVGMAPQ